MATMPKTIGIFAGLLTKEGKLRLQRRIEKDSIIPGPGIISGQEEWAANFVGCPYLFC